MLPLPQGLIWATANPAMASGGVTTGKKTLWALLLGTVLPVAASAALRVGVRVPTLHSLAAALTQGGIEPGLLMGTGTTQAAALGDLQQAELLAADMVIWAGAGLESGLGEVLGRMPALARKSMALTNSIPLPTRAGQQGSGLSRWQFRAPAFWTAPLLAVPVVHQNHPPTDAAGPGASRSLSRQCDGPDDAARWLSPTSTIRPGIPPVSGHFGLYWHGKWLIALGWVSRKRL